MTRTRPPLGRPWRRLVAHITARDPECRLRYPGICTGRSQTADHRIPWAAGGTDHLDNLQGACHACNQHKRDHPDPNTDQTRNSRTWP